MHYTCLLLSEKDGRWYTGQIGDLRGRLQEHLKGRVHSTRHRLPVRLVYYEACLDEADAKRRERYLKTEKGKKYLRQRLASWLDGWRNELERD